MPRLRALLPPALALVGGAKAAGVVWVGLHVGAPAWIIATTAALWVTGPSSVAWIWQRRRLSSSARRSATPPAPSR